MLKIKLAKPLYAKNKYLVFIDFDLKKSFSSKRKAQDYIVKIEGELNEALLFINEYYCNLNNFYRTYFIADRDFRFKYLVENCFDLINNRLTFIATHNEGENLNTFLSQSLNLCFKSLVEACSLIDVKSRARYDMITRRRIALTRKIIVQYQESFETFKAQSIYSDNLRTKTA